MHRPLLVLIVCVLALPVHAQKAPREKKGGVKLTTAEVRTKEVVYKTTPQGDLKLHFFLAKEEAPSPAPRPCVVFFFGGGWKNGSYLQFVPQAEYLASRGLVAVCADYRILNEHKTLPDKAVEDAKSAIRWVRGHAAEFQADPDKIVAAGGSAGGHLAACTALVASYDAESDDQAVSARPNALVLFNPAMNIGTLHKERGASSSAASATGFNQEMAEAITPNNFVSENTPPAVLFLAPPTGSRPVGMNTCVRPEPWACALKCGPPPTSPMASSIARPGPRSPRGRWRSSSPPSAIWPVTPHSSCRRMRPR